MTDDPREILKAAGVECAEVDKVGMSRGWYDPKASHQHALNIIEIDDAAILALARLVAKYKWQRGRLTERLLTGELRRIRACGLTLQCEVEAIAEAYRWKDRMCIALEEEWEAGHNA